LTYIPLEDRNSSLAHINEHLSSISAKAKKAFRGMHIVEKPDWDHFEFSYFKDYPSVKWKLQNLQKLKSQNPEKLIAEVEKLKSIW